MMDSASFRKHAHELVDWMADYMEQLTDYPVKSQVAPGEVIEQLPKAAPEQGEPFEALMRDFQNIIVPGMTHWQSPNFYAYFPANSSFPSILAEMLTATMGAQCMIWETSPAAAELEERMMEWLAQLIDLPGGFTGVIQDTASTATLVALLTARERASGFAVNQQGYTGQEGYRVYCSAQAHSSIEKAVKIAGMGQENLVQIPVDPATLSMQPEALQAAIAQDRAAGLKPLCVVAALGTTGTTAVDPLEDIGKIAQAEGMWFHVDAAYAGAALVLPAYRHHARGLEQADSFVFNPHKWLLTNFDCTAYYVKDTQALRQTFEILPEYLKTRTQKQVNDYRDWGIPLGRRFRALKLWFVMRSYGAEGIRQVIRGHMDMAQHVLQQVEAHADFELLYPMLFNTVCFRYKPQAIDDEQTINSLNEELMHQLNDSGELYLTHTKINGRFVLRLVVGSSHASMEHTQTAWASIAARAKKMIENKK